MNKSSALFWSGHDEKEEDPLSVNVCWVAPPHSIFKNKRPLCCHALCLVARMEIITRASKTNPLPVLRLSFSSAASCFEIRMSGQTVLGE